jgi:hypothetical protein
MRSLSPNNRYQSASSLQANHAKLHPHSLVQLLPRTVSQGYSGHRQKRRKVWQPSHAHTDNIQAA